MNENEKAITEVAENDVKILDEDDVLHLIKPIKGKDGNDIDSLVFDFDKINGRVLLLCAKAAKQEEPDMLIPNLSMTFQAIVGAKAAGIRYDDVLGLAGPDFIAVTQRASRFLNNVGKSKISDSLQ